LKAPHWDNIRAGIGIYNLLGNKNAVTYTVQRSFTQGNDFLGETIVNFADKVVISKFDSP